MALPDLTGIFGAVKFLLALKNFRFSLIFGGEDYSMKSEDNPEGEALSYKEKLKRELEQSSTKLYSHTDAYYKGSRKADREAAQFYKRPSRKKLIELGEPLTASDEFLYSVRRYPGKDSFFYPMFKNIAFLMNITFSPGFGYVVGILASLAFLASPLGWYVGATGLVISISTVAFTVYRQVNLYRDLERIKEERILLDEVKKTDDSINSLLETHPHLKLLILQNNPQGAFVNKEYTHANAMKFILTNNGAIIATNLALSIASLNPISLLLTFLGCSTGYASMGTMHKTYQDRVVMLTNHNNEIKHAVGIKYEGIEPGTQNQSIAQKLGEMRQMKAALEAVKDIRDPAESARTFQAALATEPVIVSKCTEKSFSKSLEHFLDHGLSWSGHNRLFTPFLRDARTYNTHSEETYQKAREAERTRNIAIAREPHIPQPLRGNGAHMHAEHVRREEPRIRQH